MYLKRLELGGFKTFADRTDLEFHPGITAIVGPNGSGKSNLLDAIRWALGEQNARALRGARMEDVIFTGSEGRRAHGLAQVTLTLDNSTGLLPVEFTEVSVTRRATRGGEGEYALNGVPCRLRDIQMLFLGTGLGGRSYALISQGEVEAILNASPEQRRLWLEEAAGLARYKRRRHESIRRLEHAAHHLQRLADLLAELRGRHEELAVQAEAAQRYRSLTGEIRTIELALLADEGRRLARSLERQRAQIDAATRRLEELRGEIVAARERMRACEHRRTALAKQWDDLQGRLLALTRADAAAGIAIARAEERRQAVAQEQERIRGEVIRLTSDLERVCADLVTVGAARRAADADVEALRDELAIHRSVDDADGEARAALRRQAEVLDQRRVSVLASRHDLAQDVAALLARAGGLEHQATALAERLRRLERHESEAAAEERRLIEQIREMQVALDGDRIRERQAAEQVQASESERAALADELAGAQSARQRLESRLQLLDEAAAQPAGYEAGARAVLAAHQKEPGRLPGTIGTFVDYIRVGAEFRGAVEAALGRRLYCVLIRGLEAAREGLALLRANGGEPVSFLPLDRVPATESRPSVPVAEGVIGHAVDAVEAAPEIQPAVWALLGDVVVADDLDAALRCRAAGHLGRVVTRQGELLSPEGVISAPGRPNGWGSPLARREEIERTHAELQEVVGRAAVLERQIEMADRGGRERREARAAADAACRLRERELTTLEASLTAVTRERRRLPVEREEVRDEQAALQATLADLDAQRRAWERQVQDLDQETLQLEEQLAAARRTGDEWEAAVVEHRRAAQDLQLRLAELDARQHGLRQRTQDLQARRDDLLHRRSRSRGLEAALGYEAGIVESELERAQTARRSMSDEDRHLSELRVQIEQGRAEAEEEAASAATAAGDLEPQVRDAEGAMHRAEVRAAQIEAEWRALQRRIRDEHGLEWDAVEALRPPLPLEEARGRLEALRGLVAAMGPVNLRAIAEQEALRQRIVDLARQVDDLTGASQTLGRLIAQLDGVLRLRFRETFEAVSAEFGRLLQRLFEGGSAHLELTEQTPESEAALEVIVRLPGKKQKPLAALSGGERVLVALALLFAMLRVHPSPFCVFDEVEAALDDANTARFTRLLRDLARETQIMIITHNKGTMEAADILHGVTMQEPGVSSILSVRLTARARSAETETQAPDTAGAETVAVHSGR